MKDNNPLIKVDHLVKQFGNTKALNDVSAEIRHGEVVVVVGPSGSGKSTFLRCLNLLEEPTDGQIFFEGTDITDPKTNINTHRQKMGMVFQQFNLFPHMTIMDNLILAPTKILKKSPDEAKKYAMELLEKVGLADRAESYPNQLSGGQKQRISIARTLLKKSKILIFDDSTSALDTGTEAKIQSVLKNKYKDVTKIIIAQKITSVMNSDKIILIHGGKIIGEGTHDYLMANSKEYREIYESQIREEDELNGR